MDINSPGESNLLSELIKETDSSHRLDRNSETLVLVDAKGQVHTQKPGGFGFLGTYKYYEVNFTKTLRYDGYIFTLKHNDGLININISYKFKCNLADAQKLALAVFRSGNTPINPKTIIYEEILAYDERNSLADDFYRKKLILESAIGDKFRGIGLTLLTINIQLVDVRMFDISFASSVPKVRLGLSVEMRVIPGMEVKAMSKILTKEALEDNILKITTDYISENSNPADLYKNYNTTIKEEVRKRITEHLNNYGREVTEFAIKLFKPGSLQPIIIGSEDLVSLRLKNSHQILQLRYTCELVADPAAHALVYLFQADSVEIREVIMDEIKKTFAAEIDIEQFAYELNTTVSSKLAIAINTRITSWGRVVGYLQLETPTVFPPRHLEVNRMVRCITKDGIAVNVNNKLLLQRNSAAAKMFEASQVKNFFEWGANELERVTKNVIIQKTVNELLYVFDDSEVKNEIQKEAERYGYQVYQLITIPELDEFKERDRFNIDYQNTGLTSKTDGIKLSISLHMEGRIPDFTKAMKILGPKEKISESIKGTVGSKIVQFFHSVDPDRFYLRFYTHDTGMGEKHSLEEEIRDLVKKTLEEDYGADIRTIVVNQPNTEIIDRLKKLQEGILVCEFHDRTGFLKYRSTISITRINPESWLVFYSNAYPLRTKEDDSERQAIVKHVKGYLENILNNIMVPKYKNGEFENLIEIEDAVRTMFDQLIKDIIEIFGLEIKISRPIKLERESEFNDQLIESNIRKNQLEIESSLKLKELSLGNRPAILARLYKLKEGKIADGALMNDPELKKINEEIATLENSNTLSDQPLELKNPFEKQLEDGKKRRAEDNKDAQNNNGR